MTLAPLLRPGAPARMRCRPALAAFAAALLIWTGPSRAPAAILIWGAALAAIPFHRRFAGAWLNPPGLAALAVGLFAILSLAWTPHPAGAARELLKDARIPAGLFALAVFVRTPRRIEVALLASGAALAVLFAADLVRLFRALGPAAVMAQARFHEPYLLTHPNVSGLFAGLTIWFALYAGWTFRRSPVRLAAAAAAALAALAHLVVLGSRGPQIAFAASAAAAFVLVPATARGRLAGGALAALAALVLVSQAGRINARFAAGTGDRFAGREVVWRQTWQLARERPWLGYGYGKRVFHQVYYVDAAPAPESPHPFPHPHQYALFALFQGGRIGLGIRLALWGLLAVRLLRALARRHENRLLLVAVCLPLLMIHVFGLADFPDSQTGLALAWLIPLALALSGPPGAHAPGQAVTRTSACGCADRPASQNTAGMPAR